MKGQKPSILALVFLSVDMSTALIRYEITLAFAKQTYRARQPMRVTGFLLYSAGITTFVSVQVPISVTE